MQHLPTVIALVALLVAICGLFALWLDAHSTSSPVAVPPTNDKPQMAVYGRDGMLTSLIVSPNQFSAES